MDGEALMRRWWAGLITERIPPLDLCHERIEISNPPSFPVRGTFRGHDGVRRWAAESWDVIDELDMQIEDVFDVADGATVVLFLRLRGVAAHTRIPIDETWGAVCEIRDDKLLRARGFISRREALRTARAEAGEGS